MPHHHGSERPAPGRRQGWLTDTALLVAALAITEVGTHWLLAHLSLQIPKWADSLVDAFALAIVTGPLLGWTLWRRRREVLHGAGVLFDASSPHRKIRWAMHGSLVFLLLVVWTAFGIDAVLHSGAGGLAHDQVLDLGIAAAVTAVIALIAVLVVEPVVQLVREQHAAVSAQAEVQSRLAAVAQHTHSAVAITGVDGRIQWINDGFRRLYGEDADSAQGADVVATLRCERTAESTAEAMRAAMHFGEPWSGQVRSVARDGRRRCLAVEVQPRRDAKGALAGFLVIETDVTELAEVRDRLSSTFEAVAEGIAMIDQDGQIVECNRAAEEILGVTRAQLTAKNAMAASWRLVDETGRALATEEVPVHVTLKTGQATRGKVVGLFTDSGERRWISVSTQPVRDADGQVVACCASFGDVTDLREQADRMELVTKAASLGTWDWHIPSGTLSSNDAGGTSGAPSGRFVQGHVQQWRDSIHPEDLPEVTTAWSNHFAGLTPDFRVEYRMRTGDDQWVWVLDVGKVLERDADGRPLRAAGVHVDIQAQKVAEQERLEAQRAAEAAYREISALRAALDEHSILSITDRHGRIVEVNTGFVRVSGYAREELLGQDHRLLNSGVHDKRFWAELWSTLAKGKAWRGVVCNRHKDGSHYWVDSTIVPFVGEDGEVDKYVSMRFDVTAQKAAELQLVEARAQAEAANAAKSEFLANMSHEIRTPMTAILGYAELLASDPYVQQAPQQQLEHVGTIRRNGEHLLSIINDILDLSKIEAGKMTVERARTSPIALVEDVMSLMQVKATAKGLRLAAEFVTDLPESVESDALRLRQVLVNLVGNAIKFTEIGGVTLRCGCAFDREELWFEVVDTGIGMAEPDTKRLFGAFVQVDSSTARRFHGTGLGLRISKRLAEMLGGDITVHSELGKGSAFRLAVGTGSLRGIAKLDPRAPLQRVQRDEDRSGRTAANAPSLAGVRVLLAEDGPDNQRLIAFLLKKAGADVATVANGKLAVEAMTVDGTLGGELADPPPFDLVITDIQMPEMDGYTTARTLRKKGASLPIVALTAHAMQGDMERCLAAGCDGYAQKPIDRQKLLAACREAIDGKAQ